MFGDTELLKDSQSRLVFARMGSVKQENEVNANRACYGRIYHKHAKGHKLCLLYKYVYVHQHPMQMEAKSPFFLMAWKEVRDMENV